MAHVQEEMNKLDWILAGIGQADLTDREQPEDVWASEDPDTKWARFLDSMSAEQLNEWINND